jgi:threonine dehydratase
MLNAYVRRILDARIYDLAVETPIDGMRRMSAALGCRVLVKREDLQPVFSFKIRGAYNRLLRLTPAQRRRGVITASAGNHAQGVAMAAAHLGIHATIVMPVTTPEIKVESVRARGARVVLHGDRYDDARVRADEMAAGDGLVGVPAYDDPDVIAGQGTIGMEIVRQVAGPLDAVFVPVGGGGLIAGVGAFLRAIRPEVRIVGVEPDDAACMKAALAAGRPVKLKEVGLFADGVAVAQAGRETFRVARRCVDEIVTADTDEMCAAVKELFEDTRSIAEPAGALALAGLKKVAARRGMRGRTFLAIHSGANINFDRLRYVSERTDLGEKREALLSVDIPERAGSLREFCRAIGGHDIWGFNYRHADAERARILVAIRLDAGRESAAGLVARFGRRGYRARDLSGNELAKVHVAHMVGGRPPAGLSERLFRFEFPERRGALRHFLDCMDPRWSISLFHYRRQGGSYGHVLIGLLVPPRDGAELRAFLRRVDFPCTEESANPAYRDFLA